MSFVKISKRMYVIDDMKLRYFE